MSNNAERQPQLSWWWRLLAGIGLAALLFAGIWALIWPLTNHVAASDVSGYTAAARPAHLQSAREAVRSQLLTLGAGVFAAGALVFTALNFGLARRQFKESSEQFTKQLELSRTTAHDSAEAERRTLELTEQGQVTDRYTKAIEQLGSDKLDVRIGGIYALERIARDSTRDHPTVIEVLAAFIREHSREPLIPDGPFNLDATRADVQAVITVIGRRDPDHDSEPVNLRRVHLVGADLIGARLNRAKLQDAVLTGANLSDALLDNAILDDAHLVDAYLFHASLRGASLYEADLSGASLAGAKLEAATLTGANLHKAVFRDVVDVALLDGANLKNARLTGGVDLTGVRSDGADFSGADLTGAKLGHGFARVKLHSAILHDVDLSGAKLPAARTWSYEMLGADFEGTKLACADLSGVNITAMIVSGANIEGADLTGAVLTDRRLTPEGWVWGRHGRLYRVGAEPLERHGTRLAPDPENPS